MDPTGEVVVVTGAGSGIGAALARRFRADGVGALALVDIDEASVSSMADELGALGRRCDVADEHDVVAAIDHIESTLGPIGLYCSNAGIGGGGGFAVETPVWDRTWDVNVMAHVHAARVLVPRWLERESGHLMVTASAAGLLTQLGSAPYAVTKAAAVAFAEWITITFGDRGVTASALCPQGVATPMTAGLEQSVVAVDGLMDADTVAERAIDDLRAGRFLLLPHPEVAEYTAFKGADRDRWIRGMRRLQARYPDELF